MGERAVSRGGGGAVKGDGAGWGVAGGWGRWLWLVGVIRAGATVWRVMGGCARGVTGDR